MTVKPGTSKSHILLFFVSFFSFFGYWEQAEPSQLADFWEGGVTAREYNLRLLKPIWTHCHCLPKIILSFIIIQKTLMRLILWWLIGQVLIKDGLILTAHLCKLLKPPSQNCCLLPDNVEESQITPAYCKLWEDLCSLAQSRKIVYNRETEKSNMRLALVSSQDCCGST